jgi:galactose-1-phosphate uridylyltransferase
MPLSPSVCLEIALAIADDRADGDTNKDKADDDEEEEDDEDEDDDDDEARGVVSSVVGSAFSRMLTSIGVRKQDGRGKSQPRRRLLIFSGAVGSSLPGNSNGLLGVA